MRYNVAKSDGTVMLGLWVGHLTTANKWLRYYREKYAPGSPFPNEKGFYPDFGFHIIRRHDEDRSVHRRR